ncbi:MAG TPA: short-chain dehydrogenase, partial [Micromonosporaceae bacterium]
TAHRQGHLDPDDLSSLRQRYVSLAIYGSAKQANILFAQEAARRWPDILSTAYHPGVVRTRFGNDTAVIAAFYRYFPLLRTPAKGADTLVWLATTNTAELRNGAFYIDRRERPPAARAADPALAARLWDASLAAVGRA